MQGDGGPRDLLRNPQQSCSTSNKQQFADRIISLCQVSCACVALTLASSNDCIDIIDVPKLNVSTKSTSLYTLMAKVIHTWQHQRQCKCIFLPPCWHFGIAARHPNDSIPTKKLFILIIPLVTRGRKGSGPAAATSGRNNSQVRVGNYPLKWVPLFLNINIYIYTL